MNLRQLKYFARIVETGNITRAAEELYVAQPALGMQIRQLEDELGVALLSRHSRGVSPTRAGQILYERACEILRMVDETERQVAAAGRMELEGIVLGLTNGFLNIVGRDLILQSSIDLPAVKLSVIEERSIILVDALERHEIDITVGYEVHERPGLLRVPLFEEELLFVMATEKVPKGLRSKPVEFRDIAKHTLVMAGQQDGSRQLLMGTAKRLAIDMKMALEVSSITTIKAMVAAGDGAGIMPYGNAADFIADGRFIGRRIANPPLKRTFYLVRSLRRAPFKYEEELLELLATHIRRFVKQLGPLAKPLEALDKPFALTFEAMRNKDKQKP